METKHMNFEVKNSANAFQIWNAGERIATINNAIIGQAGAANLLAAAPDLLKEAKNILMHRNQDNLHPKDFQRLEKVIAKAEGRE